MRRLMSRSHSLYQKRHDGRSPRRVVVYKTTPFRNDETNGCLDSWGSIDVDLIQVQQDTPWRGVRVAAPHEIAGYLVHRGSCLPLSPTEALCWTQGIVPNVTGEKFYAPQKEIPAPLQLTHYAGHSGWEELCWELLALTKMNWNNDSLYDRLPVTIEYASSLARIVKRLPTLSPRPSDFRYFM
jgi:argonaute-like protein implicated in RNA metabolism and viral defense